MIYIYAFFLLSPHRVQASLDSKRIVCLVLHYDLSAEGRLCVAAAWFEFCPVATVRLH